MAAAEEPAAKRPDRKLDYNEQIEQFVEEMSASASYEENFNAICQRIRDSKPSKTGKDSKGIAEHVKEVVETYLSQLEEPEKRNAVYDLLEALASKKELLHGEPSYKENSYEEKTGRTELCVPGQRAPSPPEKWPQKACFWIETSPQGDDETPRGDILVLAPLESYFFELSEYQLFSDDEDVPFDLKSLLQAARAADIELQHAEYREDTQKATVDLESIIAELASAFFEPFPGPGDRIRAAFLDIATV